MRGVGSGRCGRSPALTRIFGTLRRAELRAQWSLEVRVRSFSSRGVNEIHSPLSLHLRVPQQAHQPILPQDLSAASRVTACSWLFHGHAVWTRFHQRARSVGRLTGAVAPAAPRSGFVHQRAPCPSPLRPRSGQGNTQEALAIWVSRFGECPLFRSV